VAKNPILLVEGIDDASVIGNLLNENGFKTLKKSDPVSDLETDIIIRGKGSVVRGIPAAGRLFNEPDEIKADIHTFLAWQARPGVPMGLAIGAKYLLADTPETQKFLTWARRLFLLPPS
jgi:hypothetical protein